MTQRTETELLTIAELARSLELPESTTRYYCNRFANHLPSVGEGRRRRFKRESLNILKTIAKTMRQEKNAYAVDLVLHGSAKIIPSVPKEQTLIPPPALAGQMLALMENQNKALQEIAGAIRTLAEQGAIRPALSPTAIPPVAGNSSEAETAEVLRKEISLLREQIRESEHVHQNDLEQLRKWLSRLGEALGSKQT